MISYNLIKSVLSDPWAIEQQSIEMLMPMINGLFDSHLAFERGEPILPKSEIVNSNKIGSSKNVNIITISGALTKEDQFCGPAGMTTIGNWIMEADNNPSVDSIVLKIDSPGGTVSGTEELGNIIKNTKKPIVAFIEDMGCSAAYWLACNSDEIIANNTTAIIGSIGVLMSFADVQPMYEAQGIKFHKILAPQSSDKTMMFDKLRAGDYEQYKNEVLKPLADKFISVVSSNRSGLDEKKYFTGKTFFAKDVVGELIDSIGSLDYAISKATSLTSGVSASLKEETNTLTMLYPNLAKAAGVESFEAIDGTIDLSAEMAEAVDIVLQTAETAATDLAASTAQLATSNETIATQNTAIETLNATIADQAAQIEALKQAPGAINPKTTEATDAAESSVNMNFLSADTIELYKQIKQ